MSAGRVSRLNLADPGVAERFRKLTDDVEARRLPISVAARELGFSEKQLRRHMAQQKDRDQAAQTYREVDKWEHLPKIQDFENWVNSRGVTPSAKDNNHALLSYCRRIWAEAWNKKNLQLLNKEDMVAFITWKNLLPMTTGAKFTVIKAARLFLRFGYGDYSWLETYLDTKGKKGDPRMPPELKVESMFRTIMPKIYMAGRQLLAKGELNHYEYEAHHLAIRLKSLIQIRTGDHEEQRELWGIVINNPSNSGSSLLVDDDGRVQHLTAKCKGQETWEIPREAFQATVGLDRVQGINETEPPLLVQLETFIHNWRLKTGDYLFDEERLSSARSNKILEKQSALAGLSDLNLHDMRKVSATSLALAEVRVEDAINFGVGWKDSATYLKYYMAIKGANMKRCYAQLTERATA